MSGRARGRARGRAGGDPGEPPRRPGALESDQEPQQAEQPLSPATLRSGRAQHRSGTRPRVGPSGEPPTGAMAALSVRGAPRERRLTAQDDEKVRTREIEDKRGVTGIHVDMVANYFTIHHHDDGTAITWYHYRVDFQPEVDSRRARVMMVKHQAGFQDQTAFDGQTLYMARPAPTLSFVTQQREADNTSDVTVTLTEKNRLHATDPECMRMLNIIFRRMLYQNRMYEIGRNYYNPEEKVQIPAHNIEVWPGFCTSIGQYESGVLLCADISHKFLGMRTVLERLNELFDECGSDKTDFLERAKKALLGEIVLTTYNNKKYRVDDLDFTTNPLSTFTKLDGSVIQIKEYYRTQYRQVIVDDNQPLLVSRPRAEDRRAGRTENFLLVPELCVLTGLTDLMRRDERVMRDIAVHTRVGPQDRADKLETLIATLSANPTSRQEMHGWGLQFAQSLIRLQGRKLPAERILQPGCDLPYREENADWTDRLKRNRLVSHVDIEHWLLLVSQRDLPNAEAFYDQLRMVSRTMGIEVRLPTILPLKNDQVTTYTDTLKSALDSSVQMVVCIVPNDRKDRYDAIKKICCIEFPVPSQVILARTISNASRLTSVATKIAIQMNAKLGGVAWAVPIPMQKTMVCGFDSYYDSTHKNRSVGAFVASYDSALTRYYSRSMFQSGTQELHDGLRMCMQGALRKYQEINNVLPDRVVVYRDGVGDGQLEQVYRYEIPQLMEAFRSHCAGYQPHFGVIVVKKRINTRLFARASEHQLVNPVAGTVVDNTVTRPMWYDFFLISQSVRQGTVSPTHYNVIHDTMKLSPDYVQRLTYKMTHLYYNWPGTIRVPAPCLYAHKLAQLVGMNLHREPHAEMCDKLFYL